MLLGNVSPLQVKSIWDVSIVFSCYFIILCNVLIPTLSLLFWKRPLAPRDAPKVCESCFDSLLLTRSHC